LKVACPSKVPLPTKETKGDGFFNLQRIHLSRG
jgi:hypothetical protein